MEVFCSLCDELITGEGKGQFFPEDDSYICMVCLNKYQKPLINHSHGDRPSHLDSERPVQAGEV